MFVDSHCHLDRLELDKLGLTLDQVLDAAKQRQIQHMLCVSVSLAEFPSMLALVKPYANVSVSCGEHPLHQSDSVDAELLARLATSPEVVAVGETGLDYFYNPETKLSQQDGFVKHISVARSLKKPLIIHTRDARADTIALMKSHQAEQASGVLHCFTENYEMAKKYIDYAKKNQGENNSVKEAMGSEIDGEKKFIPDFGDCEDLEEDLDRTITRVNKKKYIEKKNS